MKKQFTIVAYLMMIHCSESLSLTSRYPAILKTSRQSFHSSVACRLNRFLFDPSDVDYSESPPTVTLPKEDYRTLHASKILKLHNGETVRSGIVGTAKHLGQLTDEATIQWIPEGMVKKAAPFKNGDPPGSLKIFLDNLTDPPPSVECRVSLILALPRPLQLGRVLTMIAQLGVEKLVLVGAHKVPKDYFGSQLFRKPGLLERKMIEGLCQAGDVTLPEIKIERSLSKFLNNQIDEMFPKELYARVIAHPQREGEGRLPRIRDVELPEGSKRIVVAVGPEGGWLEPDELDLFTDNHSFTKISMGNRVLRSDCAVVSLLSLAHDAVDCP